MDHRRTQVMDSEENKTALYAGGSLRDNFHNQVMNFNFVFLHTLGVKGLQLSNVMLRIHYVYW